ncbi:MAG: DUF411 domain-containing protein [Pseudomonadota bacterium]|nr:DUF411 domain-containing protein [Pseudomonadota bacterium]
MNRRGFLWIGAGALAAAAGTAGGWLLAGAPAGAAPRLLVHRSPSCGCCGAWIEHMAANGFDVEVEMLDDLGPVKTRLGVPATVEACHTATVGGYVVEGHVPAADVHRLLAERPAATGLAVPGMPIGSPGMEQGSTREPYRVILFGQHRQSTWSTYS